MGERPKPFYEFGQQVQKIVPSNSRIMYGLTVKDAWCVTKRNNNGSYLTYLNTDRAKEETNHYNVDYLLLDLSENIHKRNQIT